MADEKPNHKADAFIKEVEEDLRREQLEKLWENYGVYAIGVAALIVVGIGGYRFMETRRPASVGETGAAYSAATRLVEQKKTDEALKAYDALAKGSSASYATLSKLRIAGDLGRSGKAKEAITLFDEIAKGGGDQLLASYASLQSAMLMVDTAGWTEIETRLKPLIDGTSPWRHMARETLGIAAIKAGRTSDARRHLGQVIADQNAPPALIERARTLMAIVTEGELGKRVPRTEAPKAPAPVAPVKAADPKPAPAPAAGPEAKTASPAKPEDGKPIPPKDGTAKK